MLSRRIRSPRQGSARSGGRWVGLGASALFISGVSLVTPIAPVAAAADCADAEVVFARGTDEPPGLGRVGDAFVDSLRKQTGGMNIKTYAVNYKASKLQLHGGDGAKDAISHIKSTASSCPDTRIVLGGYSQGASVIDIVAGIPVGGIKWGDSLPPQYANNVAAVATFGDVATRTGEALPTQSALLGSKAIDLCNPNDPICHAGPGNEWSGHTEGYIPVYTTQAAAFAAAKLLAGSGQTVPGYGPEMSGPGYGPETSVPGYGPLPGYGPSTPGYGPDSSVHGPPPGYGPVTPGYGPEAPGYGLQPPGSGSSIYGPASPSPEVGLVSAVH
ncbi:MULTISPECIES: cutinase family protein [unclassified Mycolicibacterium]|uniref:cutinase family protein n=1 Tax=unclassified Mycolicibacterium TaxID=2636767 RepID=UPI0012DBF6EE|nr:MULTISPECIES: cutinase family protein [unclassified Mycolicibacterium]MUL80858.1 cutinase family protein [Mycolicibacterium sp. CBMA 329]MUL86624.1 cutinase family protein [Mycolicibacterium sp. CBMA 331]MUM02828.1 cutinase family protein [Mycolicibacterium sp. CBMA 334]MUM27681.1 cutinase family protein [Mycolicibacterium sp. CBMA 295]MUM36921.1 cutinase family protein [Mycolicibacterium sp. CBMA 247]